MIVIIIKIINEQQLTTILNHEPGTFFQWSDGGLTPLFLNIFHCFEKKVLPFVASFVNPLVFTRWRRTPGCCSATSMNNSNNFIKQQHWTMNIFSVMVVLPLTFFHSHFLRRRSYPSSFHLSILWSSPGGKDLLVFTGGGGQGVPKNHRTMLGDSFSGTAAGWIVSVGDVGLNAHHFWSNNPWFLLCFSMFFH